VLSEPGRLAVTRENSAADCDITGPAAGLYLLLWNRRDASGLEVRGDAGSLAGFREHFRVTWH
jgi:hypothetical protein